MNRRLQTLAVLAVLVAPGVPAAQEKAAAAGESLSAFMNRRLGELNLVGAGVGVLHPNGTTWAGGFGLADMEQGIPASGDTIALWASSSRS